MSEQPSVSQDPEPQSPSLEAGVSYAELDPKQILTTIGHLHQRIAERFPERGIARICGHLEKIAARAHQTGEWIGRPIVWVRVASGSLIVLLCAGLWASLSALKPAEKALSLVEFVQGLEAGINDLVLIGAGLFFLLTLETRIKRKRALSAIHELRALVHIIDMHQLTKDPERLLPEHRKTSSSPARTLSRFELNRYLDYCSEMLSLCAKLAALYAQRLGDSVVLSAVGEVENLAIGLTNNIWQKIAILQALDEAEIAPQDEMES